MSKTQVLESRCHTFGMGKLNPFPPYVFSSTPKLLLTPFELETLIRLSFLTQSSYKVENKVLGEEGMWNIWKKTSTITWSSTKKSIMTVHSRTNVIFRFAQIRFKLEGNILKLIPNQTSLTFRHWKGLPRGGRVTVPRGV